MAKPRRAASRTRLDPARRVAFGALLRVETADAYLNLALPAEIAAGELSARDAAFATELSSGTARRQGTYDVFLEGLVRGGVAGLQPEVRVALRLGVHQLLAMRVAAHAAVGSTVELVRSSAGERPVRMVNAVLRRLAQATYDQWVSECAPERAADPVGHLAVRHAHPAWVVSAFAEALGADDLALPGELDDALTADNAAPAVTLAVRPGLASVAECLDGGTAAGRWSPYALRLTSGDPGRLAIVQDGRAGVQDEGSQLACLALARASTEGTTGRWLDMCAGPGGKAALLTGLAHAREARVVAAESRPRRAALVRDALRGYPSAPVLVADGTVPAWEPGMFDRVLVDAPCSGLGALRRRPEARWRRSPGDLETLVPLQHKLLESALESVRPGGVVAYVTCSPHVAETRHVVDAALATRGDVHEEDARALLPEMPDLGSGPHAQLWPHRHGTDAMFIAVLRR